jgi:hypothetical protein
VKHEREIERKTERRERYKRDNRGRRNGWIEEERERERQIYKYA